MFVAGMSFHAQVSDPRMGGTYMTLLNTLTNLGSTWAGTSVLWLVDIVSFKDCEGVTDLTLDCDTMQELQVEIYYIYNYFYVFDNLYITHTCIFRIYSVSFVGM